MNDKTREAMHLASLTNVITRPRQVTTIVHENFTLDEVIDIMTSKSPVAIYVLPYSEKVPCIWITKIIMPSHKGVYMYWNSAADKTPKFKNWPQFYEDLLNCGFINIRF